MKSFAAFLAIVISFLFSSTSFATDLILQSGSWQGFANIGVAKTHKNWDFIFSYGYTPESIGGHDIHQFQLKTNYNFSIPVVNIFLYPTLFLIYNPDPRLQILSGDPYPDSGYYPSTALLAGLGIGIRKDINKKHGVFIEWSILSPEIERFYNNRDYDDPLNNYFGMGLGYRYKF